MQGRDTPLSKAVLSWVTDENSSERCIAASCGKYTILWDFHKIKHAQPGNILQGKLTLCDYYMLIQKNATIVSNAFMHANHAGNTFGSGAVLVATKRSLYSYNDDDESSDFED